MLAYFLCIPGFICSSSTVGQQNTPFLCSCSSPKVCLSLGYDLHQCKSLPAFLFSLSQQSAQIWERCRLLAANVTRGGPGHSFRTFSLPGITNSVHCETLFFLPPSRPLLISRMFNPVCADWRRPTNAISSPAVTTSSSSLCIVPALSRLWIRCFSSPGWTC